MKARQVTRFRAIACALAGLSPYISFAKSEARADEMTAKYLGVAAHSQAFLSQRPTGELRTIINDAPDQEAPLLAGDVNGRRSRLIVSRASDHQALKGTDR